MQARQAQTAGERPSPSAPRGQEAWERVKVLSPKVEVAGENGKPRGFVEKHRVLSSQ